VGCQICEGPRLDKDCPLNEDVKQVEEVKYGEFGRTMPFNWSNGGKFRVGPLGYYTKTNNHPPYGERRKSLEEPLAKHQEESVRRSTEMEVWIKKLQENAEINTRNQNAPLKNLETQIKQLTEELYYRKISFLSDSQEENTNDLLPTKESNPGHFTLPCTISKRYSKWGNENSHDKKPRPRDYIFKEWVKLKKGYLDISKSVRKDLFRLWVIDQFTEALDLDKDPLERCLDKYNWVFHKEINQLADEYKIKIREKGQVLEEIWTKCKRARCKNKDCFICVNGENNETLSLGRKNGSRFRKMIMEEMEEVRGNDKEDSDDEM
ncbi:hypothetical protein Tco_0424882, partial [Tanacetum coccineum]